MELNVMSVVCIVLGPCGTDFDLCCFNCVRVLLF